jgi:hypothetical protein
MPGILPLARTQQRLNAMLAIAIIALIGGWATTRQSSGAPDEFTSCSLLVRNFNLDRVISRDLP